MKQLFQQQATSSAGRLWWGRIWASGQKTPCQRVHSWRSRYVCVGTHACVVLQVFCVCAHAWNMCVHLLCVSLRACVQFGFCVYVCVVCCTCCMYFSLAKECPPYKFTEEEPWWLLYQMFAHLGHMKESTPMFACSDSLSSNQSPQPKLTAQLLLVATTYNGASLQSSTLEAHNSLQATTRTLQCGLTPHSFGHELLFNGIMFGFTYPA